MKALISLDKNDHYWCEIRDEFGYIESATTQRSHKEAMDWLFDHGVKREDIKTEY